jgi:hypothetical protein
MGAYPQAQCAIDGNERGGQNEKSWRRAHLLEREGGVAKAHGISVAARHHAQRREAAPAAQGDLDDFELRRRVIGGDDVQPPREPLRAGEVSLRPQNRDAAPEPNLGAVRASPTQRAQRARVQQPRRPLREGGDVAALRQGLVQSQQIGRSERLKARRLRRSGEDRHERLPSGDAMRGVVVATGRPRGGGGGGVEIARCRALRQGGRSEANLRPCQTAPSRNRGGGAQRIRRDAQVALALRLLIQRLEPSDEIVARPRRKPCLGGVAKSSAHRRDGHTAWLQTPAFPSRSRRSSERPSAHLSCPRVL